MRTSFRDQISKNTDGDIKSAGRSPTGGGGRECSKILNINPVICYCILENWTQPVVIWP